MALDDWTVILLIVYNTNLDLFYFFYKMLNVVAYIRPK